MTESAKSKEQARGGELNPRPRRPYHKPVVRFERVFETNALSCGKTASEGQCHGSSHTS